MKQPALILTLSLLGAFGLLSPAFAQTGTTGQAKSSVPLQIIKLRDGSMVKGRLIEVHAGVYRIQTRHMGMVEIPASEITGISTADTVAPSGTGYTSGQPASGQPLNQRLPAAAGPMAGLSLGSLQQQLLADPEIKALIQSITQDPELMGLLGNRDLMATVMTMDPQKMKNNPNILQLIQHPKMQQLMEKIAQKMFAGPGMMGQGK